MELEERIAELEEEAEAHRHGLTEHEDVIRMLSEMLFAVAMSIPRGNGSWNVGASHIERMLIEREVTGRPLGSMATKILQTLRGDLRMLADNVEPPDPASPERIHLRLVPGGLRDKP